MKIKEVIACLTNNVGEIPYFRKTTDGDVEILVADEQLFCTVPKYDDDEDYAEKVAEAICQAGKLLQQAVDFKEAHSKIVQKHYAEIRKDIDSGLSRAY